MTEKFPFRTTQPFEDPKHRSLDDALNDFEQSFAKRQKKLGIPTQREVSLETTRRIEGQEAMENEMTEEEREVREK